jgi:cytochrome c biogenesis protein CcmG/thiol:disulfide interchange protein DsbE
MLKKFLLAQAFITFFCSGALADSQQAPSFELPSIYNGNLLKLDDYKGRMILIDFWASWCAPCQVSLPKYNQLRDELQLKYGTESFEVLAINVDITKQEAMNFLETHPLGFPVLREETGATQQKYQIVGLPASFLVDQNGNILFAHQGFSLGYNDYLKKEVEKRLSVKD